MASFYNQGSAEVAQLVEQRTRNAQVVGSIPILGSALKTRFLWFFLIEKIN